MSNPNQNNYAFIDGANLYLGMRDIGWKLDYRKFRIFLRDRFDISTAYIFLGFIQEQQALYANLEQWEYEIDFKCTVQRADGTVKGNCDVNLAVRAMIELDNFNQAVIVTADGDFLSLAQHLAGIGKLRQIIAPQSKQCSSLLKKKFHSGTILYIDEHREKLIYN